MKKFNIGISCIGSGVGQSVINSIKLSSLPINTIGFGTNPFAFGAYDCDSYDYTPSIYSENYMEELINKCIFHKIDLLIPGLDDEALLFAKNKEKLSNAGIKAIFSDEALISLCRDKEKMSLELNKIVDVFVKSYNKETIAHDISIGTAKFPFIAKPRDGFASKGIEIIRNYDDLKKIKDEHIIQELAIPTEDDPNYCYYIKQIQNNINSQVSEISIQIVFDNDGILLGKMASYNKLNNGVPIEIVPIENNEIWDVINQLEPVFLKLGLKGPLNIQGRITKDGLKLFEMNPRFTGITGLRALMGFNEVEACIKEWLKIDCGNNKLFYNKRKFGTRQTADKSIDLERNSTIYNISKSLNKCDFLDKKVILITGSCGYLGQNLINELIKVSKYEVWAFDLDKNKVKDLFKNESVIPFDLKDLEDGFLNFGRVDVLVHLGFTRPYGTNEQIANSLNFTNELFTKATMSYVPAIINISSQSVYGLSSKPLWKESTIIAPETTYAQAKYATELLLESLLKINNVTKGTSLRLCGLAGGQKGLVTVDFLTKMITKAVTDKKLIVEGGLQQMERLDIRDAVFAIIKLIDTDALTWKKVYNLGSGEIHTLSEIAYKIQYWVNQFTKSEVNIENVEKSINMNFGMDSSLFRTQFNWLPLYNIDDIIKSYLE